jgi:hypothetical protein
MRPVKNVVFVQSGAFALLLQVPICAGKYRDYRCEDGRFTVFGSSVTISSPDSLSSVKEVLILE